MMSNFLLAPEYIADIIKAYNSNELEKLYYTENTPEDVLQHFQTLGIECLDINKESDYSFNGMLYDYTKEDFPTAQNIDWQIWSVEFTGDYAPELNDNAEILHILGIHPYSNENKTYTPYRKFKLNQYLKEKYIVDTIYDSIDKNTILFNKKYKYIIVSCPYSRLALKIKELTGAKLIYDRTDNWSDLSEQFYASETALINNAEVAFCSSDYLYNNVPSGCDLENWQKKCTLLYTTCSKKYDIPNVEKYDTPTAVYAGVGIKKVNWTMLAVLAEQNPNWNFKFYVRDDHQDINILKDISNVEILPLLSEDALHNELSKCHIGLVYYKQSAYTDGMLPLKVYDYFNARIPTVFYGCSQLRKFSDCCFEDDGSINLDDILEKQIDISVYDKYLDSTLDANLKKMEQSINSAKYLSVPNTFRTL